MSSINIGGMDFYVSNGKAHLTASSYQTTRTNMYREGTTMAKVAVSRQAKANEILNSLNSTGSWTSSTGMKYTMDTSTNSIQDKAVSGEALASQQYLDAHGGLESLQYLASIADMEDGGISNEEQEAKEQLEKDNNIFENAVDKLIEAETAFTQKVNETIDNIKFTITEIFTDLTGGGAE